MAQAVSSRLREFLLAASAGLGSLALTWAGSAAAVDYVNLIPSMRYLVLSSPWRPTSYDECSALAQEFSAEIARLNEQHQACLDGAPSDDANSGGSCSKASCQALHSAKDSASRKSSEETSTCRKRVGDYLAEQRQEAEKRRKAAEAAEQEARQREREDAERKAKRDAERQKDDRDRRDRDAQRDRDKKEQESRAERDRQAREKSERSERDARAERDRRDREQAAVQAQADREAARAQARVEAELAIARARAEEAKRERDKKEQTDYVALLEKLKEGKDALATGKELAKNPFKKGAEMAGDAIVSKLVEKGLDVAAPIGPEGRNPFYEATAKATDKARSVALEGNPFAEKISGAAMEGVQKIHRQVIGQMDQITRQMDSIAKNDSAPSVRPATTVIPPSSNHGRGASQGTDDNPFRRPAPIDNGDGSAQGSDDNPFKGQTRREQVAMTSTYNDPQSGRSYAIPAGHSLYRSPDSGELSVVEESRVRSSNDDDRIVDGQPRCSALGRGRVLAECEKRRTQRNPFAR